MAEAAKTPDNDAAAQVDAKVEEPKAANNDVEQASSGDGQAAEVASNTGQETAQVMGYDSEDILGDLELGVSAANNNREYALREGIDDATAAEVARHSNMAKSKLLAVATGEVEHPVFEKVARMKKVQKKSFLSTISGRFIAAMDAEKAGLSRSQRNAVKKASSIERIIKIAKRKGDLGMEALGGAVSDAYNSIGFYNRSRMYDFLKNTEVEDNNGSNVAVTDLLAKYVDNVEDPVLMAAVQQSVLAELSDEGEFGDSSFAKILSELPRPINAEGADVVNKKNNETISGFVSQIEEMRDLLDKAGSSTRARDKVKSDATAAKSRIEEQRGTAEADYNRLNSQLNDAESELESARGRARGAAPTDPIHDEVRNFSRVANQLRDQVHVARRLKEKLEEDLRNADSKLNAFDTSSVESVTELEHVRSRLISTVQRFISAVEDNVAQAGDSVKLEDYEGLNELKTLVGGLTSQANSNETAQDAATIKAQLNFAKILKIGREIAKVQMATAEKRLFKPEELAVALLQRKYVEAGYSPEQARTMAAIEMVTLQRQNNMSDFMANARQARENRKGFLNRFWKEKIRRNTKFVNYKQALRGMARNQELTEHAAGAFASLTPAMSYGGVRDLFKEGKVTKEEITEYMYRLSGLLGPVKIKGENKNYTLKGAKDIAAMEQIINNLSRLTAEMSALEVGNEYREQLKMSENKDVDRAELYAKVLKQYNDVQFNNEVAISARASSEAIQSLDTKNRAQKIVRDVMKYAKDKTGAGARKVGDTLVWAGKKTGRVAAAPFKLTAAGLKNLTSFAAWVARHPLQAAGNVVAAPFRIASWGANKISVIIGRRTYEISQLGGRAFVALPGIPYTAYKGFTHGIKAAIDSSKLRMMDTKEHWQDKRLEVAATDGGHTIDQITRNTNREIENLNIGAQKSVQRQQSAQDDWDDRFRGGANRQVANNSDDDDNEGRAAA